MTQSFADEPNKPVEIETAEPESVSVPIVRSPGWSMRRALLTGCIIGAILGSIFWGAYAGTSVWICSGLLTCGHWAPITLVAVIGLVVTIFFGAMVSAVILKVHRMSRVV